MDRALEPTAYIYEGFWRNLSKDSTRNLTLTLCPPRAVILTNAIALFVAMSGGQLWTLIRFSLHQIRAASRSQGSSKMYNQQQVVLRNATTDMATARLMLNMLWSARLSPRDAIRSCIIILILAVFNAMLFMAAGAFSTRLIDAGTSVLSRSPHCGFWNQSYLDVAGIGSNPTNDDTLFLSTEFVSKEIQSIELSIEYARTCYVEHPAWHWDSSCGVFASPRLNWTKHIEAPCPFSPEVCSKDTDTITFDTGLIDSHRDLGINAEASDRLQYRRITQCTVLNDTKFTTDFISQNDSGNTQLPFKVAYANYGPSVFRHTDFTYSYSNFADFYTNFSGLVTVSYQLGNAFAYGPISDPDQASVGSFVPRDEINRNDADTLLLFLSFTGKYLQPVDDPWFSAHQRSHKDIKFETLQNLYGQDKPIGTIGCTEQHQICTTPTDCSALLGFDQVQEDIANKLTLTPKQNITLDRLIRSTTLSNIWQVVQDMAYTSTPLQAINATTAGSFTISLALPDNQWQLELERWHTIAMARLQRSVVEYGTGEIAARAEYLVAPQTDSEKWICQNLRIQSTVFQSFDVVVLILVLISGSMIILLSLRIENLSGWLQQKWFQDARGLDTWNDHDMLGRQRWRTKFDTPLPSLYPSSPFSHLKSPVRNMELRYLQSELPVWDPSMRRSQSPKRASSEVLSVGDSARLFLTSGEKPSSIGTGPPSLRSAVTADFVFDFGPPHSAQHFSTYSTNSVRDKPLPDLPKQEREFVIERGTDSPPIGPISDRTTPEMKFGDIKSGSAFVLRQGAQEGQLRNETSAAIGSSPGRWAYYSAHRRRYGPGSATSALRVERRTCGDNRANFRNAIDGNWI